LDFPAWIFWRHSGVNAARVSTHFQFSTQNCLPTQFILGGDKTAGGILGWLNWSIGHEPSTAKQTKPF
jgi:hypothetical protein